MQQRDEPSSEPDESIHHKKGLKSIEEKSAHYTASVKTNGVKKSFLKIPDRQ